MVQIRPLFVYFRSFRMTNTAQIDYNDKSVDGVHGTRTRVAGRKAQTNRLSFGGTPKRDIVCRYI